MNAETNTTAFSAIAQFIGVSRRAVLMMVVLLICTIASAQAHESEYASIYRPNAVLNASAPSASLSLMDNEELLPVNLRAEIGHFFDEPNEGVLKLPFNLSGKSDVSVVVTTLDGATAFQLERQDVAPGQIELIINLRAAGLRDGEYTVQIGLSRSSASAHYAQNVAIR
jgi:hypothetical protein